MLFVEKHQIPGNRARYYASHEKSDYPPEKISKYKSLMRLWAGTAHDNRFLILQKHLMMKYVVITSGAFFLCHERCCLKTVKRAVERQRLFLEDTVGDVLHEGETKRIKSRSAPFSPDNPRGL